MAVVLAQALNEVALRVFLQREDAIRYQERYLMQCLPIADMDIYKWSDRFQQINGWLKFFPVHTGRI